MRPFLPLILLVACDPAYPTASGTLRVAVPTAGYRELHVASRPGPCTLPLRVGDEPARDGAAVPLEGGPYSAGGGIGVSQHREHCVFAWAARDATETEPTPGAPFGVRSFEAPACDMGFFLPSEGFCGFVNDLDLVLDQRVP